MIQRLLDSKHPKKQTCQYKNMTYFFKVPKRNGIQILTTTCPEMALSDSVFMNLIGIPVIPPQCLTSGNTHTHKYFQISHPWACSMEENRGIREHLESLFFRLPCWCPNTKKILRKVTSKKWHPISDPLSDRPSGLKYVTDSLKFHENVTFI